MSIQIGVDFNNVIVRHDRLFVAIGKARRLLPPRFAGDRSDVRDYLCALPGGDAHWTGLERLVYGEHLREAEPFFGAREFVVAARSMGFEMAIIGHNLACSTGNAERRWLYDFGISGPGAIPANRIFFEDSREAQLRRIRSLACTHFIGDLAGVLTDPDFPDGVVRFGFRGGGSDDSPGTFHTVRGWNELASALLCRVAVP